MAKGDFVREYWAYVNEARAQGTTPKNMKEYAQQKKEAKNGSKTLPAAESN